MENSAPDSSLFPLVDFIFKYGWYVPLLLSFMDMEPAPGSGTGLGTLIHGISSVALGFWGFAGGVVVLVYGFSEGFSGDFWKMFLSCVACVVMFANRKNFSGRERVPSQ